MTMTTMTTMTVYCAMCVCTCYTKDYSVHLFGKRHRKLCRKFEQIFGKIEDTLKYYIVSFIFPNVCNYITFLKEIHVYYMQQCSYELYVNSTLNVSCNQCHMPRDFTCYDEFNFYMSQTQMCMNCAYGLVSTSNFLNGREFILLNQRLTKCSEEMYNSTDMFYRFDRIKWMMMYLKQFHDRNNHAILIFDLTYLPCFWNVYDFLNYLQAQSLFVIDNINNFLNN